VCIFENVQWKGALTDRLAHGYPQAWSFIKEYLATCITDYKMTVLRIDYNIDPLPIWQRADTEGRPNRSGVTEIKYITGLYALWDDLLHGNPNLKYIDDCASGGRRIDFETLHRSIPPWATLPLDTVNDCH
jgi:alpha-galactosidase